MTELLHFKTQVKCCARCQGDHADIEFKPIDNYSFASYFALCPTNGQPIMLNVSKTKKKVRSRFSMEPTPAFDRFWAEYPRKKSKGDALRAFKLVQGERILERILDTLLKLKRSPEWMKDGGQFIPYPATWLRAMGWEDQPPSKLTAAPRGIRPPEGPHV